MSAAEMPMNCMRIEGLRNLYGGHRPESVYKRQEFSVLVPFFEQDGELYLLYEKRSSTMETQPGDTCFPGGHVEKGETPLMCAVRETEEEIGIPRGNIEVISQGDTMYGAAGFSLYSFIGILQYEDLDLIRFQEDEVEEVFYVPVKKLLEVRPQIYLQRMKPLIPEDFPYDRIGITENYPWRVGTYEIPVYEIEGRVIWGMTAKITEGIIERIRNYENE